LQRAGYQVIAGWIVPEADQKVNARHRLGSKFRLKAAELAVLSDELISVSPWACSQNHSVKEVEVCTSLQQALMKELGFKTVRDMGIKVIVACGGDQYKRYRGLKAEDYFGVCMVPQDGEDMLLEKPTMSVYAAEFPSVQVQCVSSTRVWEAIEGGDIANVVRVVPGEAARLCFAPTDEELEEFPVDLHKLLPRMPELPWPAEKLMSKLQSFPEEDVSMAILILSASLQPAHLGHFSMLEKAQKRLEERGFVVIAKYLSPWNEHMASQEAEKQGSPLLSIQFRLRAAALAAQSDELVAVSTWESQQQRKVHPKAVAMHCRQTLTENFPGSMRDKRLCVFHVCGSDRMTSYMMSDKAAHRENIGVCVVPQSDEDFILEKPGQLMYVTETADDRAMHSADIRKAICEGDTTLATKALGQAAARFVLAPSALEREDMKDDLKKLQVPPLGAAEVDAAKVKLKGELSQQLGAASLLSVEDLCKLLQVLDPNLTEEEISSLMRATSKQDGKMVNTHGFLDWVFASWKAE